MSQVVIHVVISFSVTLVFMLLSSATIPYKINACTIQFEFVANIANLQVISLIVEDIVDFGF